MSAQTALESPLLVFDTASPVVSVALGTGSEVFAERSIELRQSSRQLMRAIDEVFSEAEVPLTSLGGVAVLRGPGSFTGLRVGMATALGLCEALRIPAVAIPTLPAIANWLQVTRPGHDQCVAVVDALRDHWFVQRFTLRSDDSGPVARGEPERWPTRRFDQLRRGTVVGFGVERCTRNQALRLIEPRALAAPTLRMPAQPGFLWDRKTLLEPFYLSGPAVTVPKSR